jgi:hypothetical protein
LALGAICLTLTSVSAQTAGRLQRPPGADAPASPRAVLNRYCVSCHNQRVRTADLALDEIDPANVSQATETWEKVVRKLRGRVMPPVGRPRPDESAYEAVTTALQAALDAAAAAHLNPGRTDTFRRLNRTEYRNVIRDLLALDVDVSTLLPADDSSHGFDNVSVSGLSPMLFERYLMAARKISRLAIGTQVRAPIAETVVLPLDLTQDYHVDGMPFGTRGGLRREFTFPADGEYTFEVRLGRDRLGDSVAGLRDSHELDVTIDGERVQSWTLNPELRTPQSTVRSRDELADAGLNVRLPVKAGPHQIGVTFRIKSSALIDAARQPFLRRHTPDAGDQRTQPVVHMVTIAGPFAVAGAGATPSRRRIFGCRPEADSFTPTAPSEEEMRCARSVLETLARRAYRRPVTDQDLQPLVGYYTEGRSDGGFEAGIEMALRGLLASPDFLFRIERDPVGVMPGAAYRVSAIELASRLSFFLWSSMPDDELLALAAQGTLTGPVILEQQVTRMLADGRSKALADDFASQWLYLRNVASTTPDARLFPDFDEALRAAFTRETELLFESIVREDRSVLDLLTANYTFVNERLARHYGIANVYGDRFRRVTLPTDSVRGGLLGQGSILTVTSYATRTSPVQRGKWILGNILGMPPPPPPPNVPPLPENNSPAAVPLTMRERMAQHRGNPACASCHAQMDPVGLSLENFDAVGRWRSHSETGTPIDVSGGLPDGSVFEGVAGLRRAVLRRPELFVSAMTEKLLTYALGRGIEPYDGPAIRSIAHAAASNDFRFSSLAMGIARSVPFQMRRAAAPGIDSQ